MTSKKWFILILLLLTMGFFFFLFLQGKDIKKIESLRDHRLTKYEYLKFVVYEDIVRYLRVHDEESYFQAKNEVKFSANLKRSLFGDEYNAAKFPGVSQVSLIDAQYTLDESEGIVFYYHLNVKVKDGVKPLSFMVFYEGDMITNLIAF